MAEPMEFRGDTQITFGDFPGEAIPEVKTEQLSGTTSPNDEQTPSCSENYQTLDENSEISATFEEKCIIIDDEATSGTSKENIPPAPVPINIVPVSSYYTVQPGNPPMQSRPVIGVYPNGNTVRSGRPGFQCGLPPPPPPVRQIDFVWPSPQVIKFPYLYDVNNGTKLGHFYSPQCNVNFNNGPDGQSGESRVSDNEGEFPTTPPTLTPIPTSYSLSANMTLFPENNQDGVSGPLTHSQFNEAFSRSPPVLSMFTGRQIRHSSSAHGRLTTANRQSPVVTRSLSRASCSSRENASSTQNVSSKNLDNIKNKTIKPKKKRMRCADSDQSGSDTDQDNFSDCRSSLFDSKPYTGTLSGNFPNYTTPDDKIRCSQVPCGSK